MAVLLAEAVAKDAASAADSCGDSCMVVTVGGGCEW